MTEYLSVIHFVLAANCHRKRQLRDHITFLSYLTTHTPADCERHQISSSIRLVPMLIYLR